MPDSFGVAAMIDNLRGCVNINDLREAARRRSHRMVFDYIDGGADDEITLSTNVNSFNNYDLLFKALAGVNRVDTSTTLLGKKIDVPFLAAPAAGHRLFHTHGESGVAKAADAVGTIFSLSTLSSVSIEEIANLTEGPKWFQLYAWKDKALIKEMIDRARESRYEALILTVDFPVTGNRERDTRNGFSIPPKIGLKQAWQALMAPAWTADYLLHPSVKYANLSKKTAAVSLQNFVHEQFDSGFSWNDAEWVLNEWNGPAVIKGIVRTEDARQAVNLGFKAVMVSNHGGRQLDRSPAPVDVLASIVDSIGVDAEIILDGGIRRGTDILIALALGARAVSFARPYLYGLSAAGERGAIKAMIILESELRRDMTLLGAASIPDIDKSFVAERRSPNY